MGVWRGMEEVRRMRVDFCLPFATEVVNRRAGTIQWLRSSEYRDQARQFYAMARSMGSSDITALLNRTVTATHDKERAWAEGGVRLPLSVWQTKGWDTAAIVRGAAPDDVEVDPKFGWTTYRVAIRSDHRGEKLRNRDELGVLRKTRTRALRRKTDAAEEKDDSSASSGESFSSEESGSSEPEGLPPSRKTEKSGKDKPAPKKQKTSAEEKRKTAAKKKAGKDFDKVEPLLKTLRAYLSDEYILDIDEGLQTTLRTNVKQLHDVLAKMRATKKSGICEYDDDMAALDLKAVKKSESVLKKKLAKIRSRRGE